MEFKRATSLLARLSPARPLARLTSLSRSQLPGLKKWKTGALRLARHGMRPGLWPKVARTGQEMHWFKKGNV